MAYCGKCGTKVDEGVKFCPSCGNPMEAPAPEQQAQAQQNTAQTDFSAKFANLNNTADTTAEYDQADITNNKAKQALKANPFEVKNWRNAAMCALTAKEISLMGAYIDEGLAIFPEDEKLLLLKDMINGALEDMEVSE